jgi:hypothetical protein
LIRWLRAQHAHSERHLAIAAPVGLVDGAVEIDPEKGGIDEHEDLGLVPGEVRYPTQGRKGHLAVAREGRVERAVGLVTEERGSAVRLLDPPTSTLPWESSRMLSPCL